MPIAGDCVLGIVESHGPVADCFMQLGLDSVFELGIGVGLWPEIRWSIRAAELEGNEVIDTIQPLTRAARYSVGEIYPVSNSVRYVTLAARLADLADDARIPFGDVARGDRAIRHVRGGRGRQQGGKGRGEDRG